MNHDFWSSVKDFLLYPQTVLVKPKGWGSLSSDARKAWRSKRRWFVVQVMALAAAIAALARTYL